MFLKLGLLSLFLLLMALVIESCQMGTKGGFDKLRPFDEPRRSNVPKKSKIDYDPEAPRPKLSQSTSTSKSSDARSSPGPTTEPQLDLSSREMRAAQVISQTPPPPPASFLGLENLKPMKQSIEKLFPTTTTPRRDPDPAHAPGNVSRIGLGSKNLNGSGQNPASEPDFLDWLRFKLARDGTNGMSRTTLILILCGLGFLLLLLVFLCCIHFYCN